MESYDSVEKVGVVRRPGVVWMAMWLESAWLLACGGLWALDVTVLRPVGGSLRTQGTEATGTFGVPMLFALVAVLALRHRDGFGWWWCVIGNVLLFLALVPYVAIVPIGQALPAVCLLGAATLLISGLLLSRAARRYLAG
jgi:hypothetical protein